MAANFAEIFIKLGLKKEGFDKGVKSTKSSFKDMGKDLLKTGAMIGGVAAGAVIAGKAIWNMGKQGAAVIQTGESFEFLLDKVGAAPDLLDQLREATLGTVDDMTLMESTLTLTAGAGDDLSKMMMNAAPQLAEIAKAANKLNPALGDTAFMYQSIGTGVKRAQPLILDNLGLTIKVGDANEQFAKSIGKTVEELTAEEKSMAILNATLAAGDTLIAQVGGSVEAAGDEMAIAEAKIANMTNEMKTRLVPVVGEAAGKFVELMDRLDASEDKYVALETAIKNQVITGEEAKQLLIDYQAELITEVELLEIVAKKTEEYRIELNMTAEATGWAAGQDRKLTTAKEDLSVATEALTSDTIDVKLAMKAYTEVLLFNMAAAHLDADAAFELAGKMGLVDEKTVAAYKAVEYLTEKYDENEDGVISLDEASEGYIEAISVLGESVDTASGHMHTATGKAFALRQEIDKLESKTIDITTNFRNTGLSGAGGGRITSERHSGGPVGAGNMYLVGEKGPELFMPNSSGSIVPNNRLRSGSGGNTYNYVRYGDRNIVTEPAQAAFLVEKQRQAQFDEIDKVI